MKNKNLQSNPEFNEIMRDALTDYQLWFTEDNNESAELIVESINESLKSGDYWHNDFLKDALTAWYDNLKNLMESTSNQDDIDIANDQIKLINQYFE